jgi:hypothetical protein
VVAAALSLIACTSPEATRSRGSGPGADTGNRGALLELRNGSDPFYATPQKTPR